MPKQRWARSKSLAFFISLALIAQGSVMNGLASETDATEAQEPPPITSPPTERMLGPVTKYDSAPSESPPPSPADSPPRDQISGFVEGESREIVSERRPNAKIFSNPDGTMTARIYGSPVHSPGPDGKLEEIDGRLDADANGFRNRRGPLDVHLARTADAPVLGSVNVGGATVSFSMEGNESREGSAEGTRLKYSEVQPGVDLEYHVGKTFLKELVVLRERPSSDVPFRFPLSLNGLTPTQNTDGSIALSNGKGEEFLRIPAAAAWDSNVDPNSGEPSYGPARLSLGGGPGQWVLTLEADWAWLDDPQRRYPVYLDPSFFAGIDSPGYDAFVTSAIPNSNYNVAFNGTYYEDKVGYYDASTGTNHTYFHYDYSALVGTTILSAEWNGYFKWSHYPSTPTGYWLRPVADNWSASGITWNNQPSRRAESHYDEAVRNEWGIVNITDWVENWTSLAWPDYGIEVDTNGNGQTYWKKLAANENTDGTASFVEVDYNRPPSMASPVSPADNATFHTPWPPTLQVSASDPDPGDTISYRFTVARGADAETDLVWDSGDTTSSSIQVPAGYLDYNSKYYWHAFTSDGIDDGPSPNWVRSFTGTNLSPSTPSPWAPSDNYVSPTTTPTLTVSTVTDPEGDPIKYLFRIATGTDGQTGSVIDSGWITANNWSPPQGSLVDGGKYYWSAQAKDSGEGKSAFSAVRSLRVDLGLGEHGHFPYDSLGPVSVNISNGNLLLREASPTFKAVGGPVGVSYYYNSKKPPTAGLTGYYFNDDGNKVFDPYESQVMVRTDPLVNFNWGAESPYPAVNKDYFLVRWIGYVTVPNTGTYYFGALSDNGVRIRINDVQVMERWTDDPPPPEAVYGTPVSLSAGQVVSIQVEYYESYGLAGMQLWINGPLQQGNPPFGALIPSSWMSTDLPGLPDGWTLSADSDGNLGYTHARIAQNQVVMVDSSGATHTYRSTTTGWTPPEGEDGVLANDAVTGLLSLAAEDGRVYLFNNDGALSKVTSALDDRNPAALVSTWGGTPARLTRMEDPVSGRGIDLTYQPAGGSACSTPSGFTPAPAHMLCKIDYSDFGEGVTELYYSNGHLARISDPGGEITDFGYDASGRLTQVRDVLTNDLISSGQIADGSADTHKTLITYDGSGRANKVTLPVPSATVSLRPEHSFEYLSGNTKVHVTGLTEPLGYARKATLDGNGRVTEERDLAGKVTTFVWDSADRLLKKIDPTGLVNTTIYDAAGRPTDSYGPGLASEFGADNRSATAPHSITNYDESINGLAATWWDQMGMAGPAKAHTTSGVQLNWGSGSPHTVIPGDSFSGRLSGEVNFASQGGYRFSVDAGVDEGVRLFVDDSLLIDRWDTYKEGVLSDSPSSYWRLGESSGTTATDSSGNSRHGTYQSGVTLGVTSGLATDPNTAVRFDGVDDKVTSTQPRFANNFSFEAWVKPTTNHEIDPVADVGYGGTSGQRYSFVPDQGGLGDAKAGLSVGLNGISVYEHGTDYMPARAVYSGGVTGWSHVVVTYKDRKPSIYLNGVLVASGNTSPRPTVYSPISLGSMSYGSHWGELDEVAVYDKALSPSRIQAHYRAGVATLNWDPYTKAVTNDAPSAYWRLGETSGTVASDASGNGKNGTYQSGVTLGVTPGAIQGDSNTAVRFDGVNDNVLGSHTRPYNNFAFEAWVKPSIAHEIDSEATSGYAGTSGQKYAFVPDALASTTQANAGLSVGINGIAVYEHGTDYMPATAVYEGDIIGWTHVLVNYINRQPKIYINGNLVETGLISPRTTVFGPLSVGTLNYGSFQGEMDEVAFYGQPLTDARIQAHFLAGKAKINNAAAGPHRISVDYQEKTGTAKMILSWTPPGGSSVPIPSTSLKPRYGLVTSQIDPDGKKTSTEFASPENGLPTATIADPAGLNLRSTTTYEAAGTGYFRRTARTLPKGSSTQVSYAYYPLTETPDNPCTPLPETIHQGGALKTSTAADPDDAGPLVPIVREFRYDLSGRLVASQVVGDPAWTCMTYDSRGRVTSTKDSSGKTTTIDYTVPGTVTTAYVDSAGGNRTTLASVDWLGRALSYTDEHGTATRTAYDQVGRPTTTYRRLSGQSETQLTALAYSSTTGRLSSLSEYASGTGRTSSFTYDDTGKLKTVTRPNGVVTTNTFDSNRGWLNNITNKKGANELSPWTYTRSLAARVSSEATTGQTRNFTYDGAGRLTRTIQGGTTRNYSYDQNSNRCGLATACQPSSWIYDNADRITTSPYATGYSYDTHGNLVSANPTASYTADANHTGSVGATQTISHQIQATALGTISASLDWTSGNTSPTFNGSVELLSNSDHPIGVGGPSTITASLTWPSAVPNPNLDLVLLDPSGTDVAASTALTGNTESLSYAAPSGGSYTLRVKAIGLGSSYTLDATYLAGANLDLELRNPSGNMVAQSSTSQRPEVLTYNVPSGSTGTYSLKVISQDNASSYTLTASFPRAYQEVIGYDANDHATSVDDGRTRVEETLSPSGRVLRRVVKDSITGAVSEDSILGYSDGDDSPSYSKPAGGGAVTTYVSAVGGLLVIDTAGTATYPITNGHGDIVGTTNSAGTYTPNPVTDEFGVGTVPANRLGWLGSHERFSVGGSLGLTRMGVRLYDSNLGRFLQVDPVEGGSANDYDYANQDCINQYDLDGLAACSKYRVNRHYGGGWGTMSVIRRGERSGKGGKYARYEVLIRVNGTSRALVNRTGLVVGGNQFARYGLFGRIIGYGRGTWTGIRPSSGKPIPYYVHTTVTARIGSTLEFAAAAANGPKLVFFGGMGSCTVD